MIGETASLWLPSLTLAVFAVGTAASALAWARGKAPLAGVTALFALGLTRQVALLLQAEIAHHVADAAVLGMGCAAIVALRAVRRTTRERNRAEDLHWDAMETVRTLTELTTAPTPDLEAKLARVLALGSSRFGLEHACAWRADGESGRVLQGSELPLERLKLTAQASRPLVLIDPAPSPTRVFFGAPVQLEGRTLGSLAFAGANEPVSRFTATDKDLLGLMAQWLAIELERNERPAPPIREVATPVVPPPAARPARAVSSRRGGDLNAAVRRSEAKMRRRVGIDGRLELALGTDLPRSRSGRISLPALIETLVESAARLAPKGRIRVETGVAGDLTLAVRVDGEGIDQAALDRVFGTANGSGVQPGAALSLAQLERLLRLGGGDLSVSLEPPRRAVLTAFLPPLEPAAAAPERGARAPQPSR